MGACASADNGNGNSTADYTRVDNGIYPARCIQVVELGIHADTDMKGKPTDHKLIMLIWELTELMEDGRPFTVNWKGTNSLGEKANLRKFLTSWRGNRQFTPEELHHFELKHILDKCCQVEVAKITKNGKDYNNVKNVVALPKLFNMPDRVNELVDFGINDIGTPEFEKLWPWVQKLVKESYEATGKLPLAAAGETPAEPFDGDEIPF